MPSTQLLCTFCQQDQLEGTLSQIVGTYKILFDTIYILEDTSATSMLCCTYNISVEESLHRILNNTISLHRKKHTNTLYTINALNLLIKELNGGVLDSKFIVPWENYKNCILVTAYNSLKKIPTKLVKIVNVNDLTK